MVELITDRTQYHVTLLNRLRAKPYGSMTVAEKAAWDNGDAAKGAYNYTDLNRVETAVAELAGRLGLNLVTKTDWTLWDVPVASEMERYLGNIVAIRDACPGDVVFPTLPVSMTGLTYEGANNIEIVLQMVNEVLRNGSDVEDPEYKYLWIEKVEGTTVYVGVYVDDNNYIDVSHTAEERLNEGRLWYVYELHSNDYFRIRIDALPGFVVNSTGIVGIEYHRDIDAYSFDGEIASMVMSVTGGASGSEDADYIRSGEIFSGEVL